MRVVSAPRSVPHYIHRRANVSCLEGYYSAHLADLYLPLLTLEPDLPMREELCLERSSTAFSLQQAFLPGMYEMSSYDTSSQVAAMILFFSPSANADAPCCNALMRTGKDEFEKSPADLTLSRSSSSSLATCLKYHAENVIFGSGSGSVGLYISLDTRIQVKRSVPNYLRLAFLGFFIAGLLFSLGLENFLINNLLRLFLLFGLLLDFYLPLRLATRACV